jgi:hypothetical protein
MTKWTWLEELGVRGAPPAAVKFAAYASTDVALFRHGGCTGVGRALTAGVTSDVAMYLVHQRRWYTSLGGSNPLSEPRHDIANVVLTQRSIWTGRHYDLTDNIASAEAAAIALNIRVPARYHHCAMAIPMSSSSAAHRQHGKSDSDAVLLVHGGKNEFGHECGDLWSFHLLPSGRGYWQQLDSVVSGAQPPVMYGHKAVLIDGGGDVEEPVDGDDDLDMDSLQELEDATWAVIGLVANTSSVSSNVRAKRSRSTSPTPSLGGRSGGRGEAKCRASSHRFEVYTLTYGVNSQWRVLVPTTGVVPPPRRDFLLSAGRPQVEEARGGAQAPRSTPRHVILVGGSAAKTEFHDAWMFDLQAESWREISFAASPSRSPQTPSPGALLGRGGGGLFLESLHRGAQLIPVHHWLDKELSTAGVGKIPLSSGMWLSFAGQICCCLLWRPRSSAVSSQFTTHQRSAAAAEDLTLLEVIPLTSSISSLAPGHFTKHLAAVWVLPSEESPVPIDLVNICRQAESLTATSSPTGASPSLLEEVAAIGGVTAAGQVFRMSVSSEALRPPMSATLQALRASVLGSAASTGGLGVQSSQAVDSLPSPSAQDAGVGSASVNASLAAAASLVGGVGDDDSDLLDDLFD